MTIYCIGGSPCSGKSTAAQTLSARYGLDYFKVDDHLARYMKMGADDGKPCCTAVAYMTPDQIWMRDPAVQCEEELLIYGEIMDYILSDLRKMDCGQQIIAEGAAFLPALAVRCGILPGRYISLTPTWEFQIAHYSRREWVPHVFEGCSDQAKAFDHWMRRDALFAQAVRRQCNDAGYLSLVNGGEISAQALADRIAAYFMLE